MPVNPSPCEENRRLQQMVVDAWEHYNRLKGLIAPTEKERAALAEAGDSANRLSAKQHEHIRVCPTCRAPQSI